MGAKQRVTVWIGTRKGAFRFRSKDRKKWDVDGPHHRGSEINHIVADPRNPTVIYATVNSGWFGPHLHVSRDGGKSWQLSEKGLELKSVPDQSLKRFWHIEPGHADEPGVVWMGADPGALFRSEDWGASWQEVASLTAHATRDKWNPGAGGMCLHSIQSLGQGRIIAAISAAGSFRSTDGGVNWEPFNGGVRADFAPVKYPEVGQCVHKLLAHPANPEMLYQQNHCGVYRAKFDAKKWTDISKGLPSRFGFGMAVPAAEKETIFTVPIESAEYRCNPEGHFQVARSRDGGRNWEFLTKGLPQKNAHMTVLREAMCADSCDPAGVYVGTQGGAVFHTRDGGERWHVLADNLPGVYSASAGVV